MIAIALAAATALAPPDRPPGREPAHAAVAAPATGPTHSRRRRPRASSPPDLSIIADPYRSEASLAPAWVDPQHPLLAPTPDDAFRDRDRPRVSPVPPDPWAPVVTPLEPPGGAARPPGAEG